MDYFVYAIYNKENDKIYIGQTKDLNFRLRLHNEKILKGYTSRYSGNWILIYSERCRSRDKALKREKQLKSFQGRNYVRSLVKKLIYSQVAQR